MANMGLTHEEVAFEYDSREDLSYFQGNSWSLAMEEHQPQQRQQQQPQQHLQQAQQLHLQHRNHQQQQQQQQQSHQHQPHQQHCQQHSPDHYQQQYQPQTVSYAMSMQRESDQTQTSTQNQYHPASMQQQTIMTDWKYQQSPALQYPYAQQPQSSLPFSDVYGIPIQTSPADIVPVSQPSLETPLALNPQYMATQSPSENVSFQWHEVQPSSAPFAGVEGTLEEHLEGPLGAAFRAPLQGALEGAMNVSSYHYAQSSSPSDTYLEVRSLTSLSDSDGWNNIEPPKAYDRNGCVDPNETIHNRTSSESSWSSDYEHQHQHRISSFLGSFELVPRAVHSPHSDSSAEFDHRFPLTQPLAIEPAPQPSLHATPVALSRPAPMPIKRTTSKPTSPIRSPTSQGPLSPTSRRQARKSPVSKATDKMTKRPPQLIRPDTEKRVGKRKGPLRPEQRKQASEIRKLRACLRCKFLKKTCDKGEPCAGCQPAHARLWQVPCTRIDIKEIGFFSKDYDADYTRHLTFWLSAANIKGFSATPKTLYISHGYGQMMPLTVREVYVRDEGMFDLDWSETNNYTLDPKTYSMKTAPMYADLDCITPAMLSDYLDRYLDVEGSFHTFVDSYCGETPFLTSMLKTAFDYYNRTKAPVIRKALKFLLAYSLTLHVTHVEGIPDEEDFAGRVEDPSSQYHGKIIAPNAVNFQVKVAMGNVWRDLQKEVLKELSSLYSSVYSGDKLKHWPTIFILAALLLAVWEFMQFDCHRHPNDTVVEKFLDDMETVPVGVVAGLFQAISQKLPSFLEWDTAKHHHVLQSNEAACQIMSEVRDNVTRYEQYLRSRAVSAKYDPQDFDSLSNKLISKLVIRAN